MPKSKKNTEKQTEEAFGPDGKPISNKSRSQARGFFVRSLQTGALQSCVVGMVALSQLALLAWIFLQYQELSRTSKDKRGDTQVLHNIRKLAVSMPSQSSGDTKPVSNTLEKIAQGDREMAKSLNDVVKILTTLTDELKKLKKRPSDYDQQRANERQSPDSKIVAALTQFKKQAEEQLSKQKEEFKQERNGFEETLTQFKKQAEEQRSKRKEEFKQELNDIVADIKENAFRPEVEKISGHVVELKKEIKRFRSVLQKTSDPTSVLLVLAHNGNCDARVCAKEVHTFLQSQTLGVVARDFQLAVAIKRQKELDIVVSFEDFSAGKFPEDLDPGQNDPATVAGFDTLAKELEGPMPPKSNKRRRCILVTSPDGMPPKKFEDTQVDVILVYREGAAISPDLMVAWQKFCAKQSGSLHLVEKLAGNGSAAAKEQLKDAKAFRRRICRLCQPLLPSTDTNREDK